MLHYLLTNTRRATRGPLSLAMNLPLWLAVAAVLSTAAGVAAQPASGKGPLLLQRIDDVLYGVDPISLAVVDRHHVSGILVRVNANQPSPPLGYSHFVADCQGKYRVAILSTSQSPMDLTAQGASARARVQAAMALVSSPATPPAASGGGALPQFVAATMLDGTRALAEFTCAASQRPAQAKLVAKDVLENGGPGDLRTALCDLQPDGAFVTREDVTVRFSDSEKVVSVNNQWLTSGKVTDTDISFGSGTAKWRIDRVSAEAQLIDSTGKLLFAGSCVARQKP
jgi:hypothetical protein